MSNLTLISARMRNLGFSNDCIDNVLEFVKNNQMSDDLNQITNNSNLFVPLRVGYLFVPQSSNRVTIYLPIISRHCFPYRTISTKPITIKHNSKTSHLNLQKKYDEKVSSLRREIDAGVLDNNRLIINGLLSVVTYGTNHNYIEVSNKINDIVVSVGGVLSANRTMFDVPIR